MFIPLDSTEWKTIGGSSRSLEWVPRLIRAVHAETSPNYRDGGAWNDVYTDLFHQHSTYLATYLALPHLVPLAENGKLEQRVAMMCLVGEILVFGQPDEQIPAQCLADFREIVDRVTRVSIHIMRAASRALFAGTATSQWLLGDLLFAFGGLRYPQSGFVVQLGYLEREGGRVEPECPQCAAYLVTQLSEAEIVTSRVGSNGLADLNCVTTVATDHSGYSALLAAAEARINDELINWPLDSTRDIMAGMAMQFGNRQLATQILDLATVVQCPSCEYSFRLSEHLRPL